MRHLAPVFLGAVLILGALSAMADDCDLPPFWSHVPREFSGGAEEFDFLFGMGEIRKTSDGARTFAVRPFWSSFRIPAREQSGMDFLWPLAAVRNAPGESMSRVALYYRWQTPSQFRCYLMPFIFCGAESGQTWWACFPFYGDMNGFFHYDRQRFLLFPLYWSAQKHDRRSVSVCWPLVNWAQGTHRYKVRALPFYAYSEQPGPVIAESWMWPFFSRMTSAERYSRGSGWLLWPLVGHKDFRNEESWSVLWPLFEYTNLNPGSRLHAPWPLVQRVHDSLRRYDLLYFFPLFGTDSHMAKDSAKLNWFALWPLIRSQHYRNAAQIDENFYALPFYWQKAEWRNAENPDKQSASFRPDRGVKGELLMLRRRFWPLFSYSGAQGNYELACPGSADWSSFPVVDRNWTPLLRLGVVSGTPETTRFDLFWGMLRGWKDVCGSGGLLWAPFYTVEWNRMNRIIEQDDGTLRADEIEVTPYRRMEYDAEHSFFFGIVKVRTSQHERSHLRLLWCIDL